MTAERTPRQRSAFAVISVGEEFAVIDAETGRQVSFRTFPCRKRANGLAYALNGALLAGPREFAKAMGTYDG